MIKSVSDIMLNKIVQGLKALIETKAKVDHNHDGKYSASNHSHTASDVGASPTSHNHDSKYASAGHNHDGAYSAKDHNHEGVYATADHGHNTYAANDHNHDGTYAGADHNHDDIYQQKGKALTREEGVAAEEGAFKSPTQDALFYLVTIYGAVTEGEDPVYTSVMVEWNVCDYRESVEFGYEIHGFKTGSLIVSKDNHGIMTFSVVPSEDLDVGYHYIARVDGYL